MDDNRAALGHGGRVSLLRQHAGFRRLWAAGAVSLCGDWLSFVAVSTLALTGGGGAMALAIVFAAHALPGALLAPVAGTLVDRFDRRGVLIAADVLAALATAGMAAAAAVGWLAAIQGLLLVRSAITSAVPPAESAAVRRLVGPDQLTAANAILAATWSTAYVAGMALGGAAAMLGPTLALVLDALSFAVAASIHATLPRLPVARAPSRLWPAILAAPRDTVLALRVAAANRPLLAAVLGKSPLAFAAGAAWISLNLIAVDAHPFGAAALSFGLLQAIRGAGTGIGPAVAARLVARGASAFVLQHAAVALMLVAVAGLTVARSPLALAVVALTWGLGTGTNWVMAHTAMQRHASDLEIGRLAAFDELVVTLAMVASAFIGAVVVEEAGVAAAAAVAVALGVVGAAAVAVTVGAVTARRQAA
ncbi:MAG: MFS transporter [Myxococcales bacterium]|nr:MFS transporter [Myxococcales bacterium]